MSPRILLRIFAASVGALIAVWCVAAGVHKFTGPTGDSDLYVDPRVLMAGEVWSERQFTVSLPVRNLSSQDLSIVGFDTSCSCTQVQPKSLVIPAGETREVAVTLDLMRVADEERLTPFTISVRPRCANSKHPPAKWLISGTVIQMFDLPHRIVTDPIVRGTLPRSKRLLFRSERIMRRIESRVEPGIVDVVVKQLDEEGVEHALDSLPTWDCPPASTSPSSDFSASPLPARPLLLWKSLFAFPSSRTFKRFQRI